MKVSVNALASLFAAALLSFSLVSCDDELANEPTPTPDVENPSLDGTTLKGGELKGNVLLKAGTKYTLDGAVLVTEGSSLTIEQGVTLEAKEGFQNYILVEKGGKIFVKGTASAPVVMTCVNKRPGAWGGLILNGKSHINEGSTTQTEINSDIAYGIPANQDFVNDDNSGSIEYLVLEYTGAAVNADIEHNGLTLNAVGNGTKIENIFVYKSSDDGVEFFGGSVNVKNFLSVDNYDDMFDFTQSYDGTLSNAYGIWNADHVSTEEDPRGIEADGNHDGKYPEAAHQSDFTVDGLTIALYGDMNAGPEFLAEKGVQAVLKIRRGCSADIRNFRLIGSGKSSTIIDAADGKGEGLNVTVSLDKSGYTGETGDYKTGAKTVLNVSEDANEGTPQSLFAWTGYDFASNAYTSKAK